MSQALDEARLRFLATLEIVRRELLHLDRTSTRLAGEAIDGRWVEALEGNPEAADLLEAFVSRYGRLQDTIGGRLLPRALAAVAEHPGSMLDNLGRAEQLGWIEGGEAWIEARELRNRLVHEYMTSPDRFAEDIRAALAYVESFRRAYRRFLDLGERRWGVAEGALAGYLVGGG